VKQGLKYPVLLVHGMGFRDYKLINYWGRIPKILEGLGCQIFYGYQDSNADVPTNGRHIANRIEQILAQTGAEKVHIIAHSKGGLDSRYAISVAGMGEKVASLTTISTPHHGSRTVDWLLKLPRWPIRIGCFFTDCWFRILGDGAPNTYGAILSFTTSAAQEFNRQVPDYPGVYYQSYAFVMKHPGSDVFMWLTNAVVSLKEGENDGLLPPKAVKWGEFKGVHRGVGYRGISHCDEIDMRRMRLSKKKGDGISDITDVYKEIFYSLTEAEPS